MKNNIILTAAAIFLSGIVFSCKKLSDLNTTLIQVELEQGVPVKSSEKQIDTAITLDANSNLDYASRRSKLLEVKIEYISYLVKDLDPNSSDYLINLKFEVKDTVSNQIFEIASENNVKLSEGFQKNLNLNPDALNRLVEIFESSRPSVSIRCTGEMDKSPINMNLSIKTKLSLKSKL